MPKHNGSRYKLSQVRASYADAVGGEEVECETDDGQVFTFPHPMFTDDDYQRQFQECEGDTARARLLLGDQYDAYVKAGGRDGDVVLLCVGLQSAMQDTLGKHRPPKKK